MKADKIAVCYERKFNLGDYSSLKLEATIWADLEGGDDPDECIRALQDKCREAVKAEYGRLQGKVQAGQSVERKAQLPEGGA